VGAVNCHHRIGHHYRALIFWHEKISSQIDLAAIRNRRRRVWLSISGPAAFLNNINNALTGVKQLRQFEAEEKDERD
jgi:hypothetical protein